MGQIRARRKAVRATRAVSDHEVRELQVRGSARFSAFLRGQIGSRDDRVTTDGSIVPRSRRIGAETVPGSSPPALPWC